MTMLFLAQPTIHILQLLPKVTGSALFRCRLLKTERCAKVSPEIQDWKMMALLNADIKKNHFYFEHLT